MPASKSQRQKKSHCPATQVCLGQPTAHSQNISKGTPAQCCTPEDRTKALRAKLELGWRWPAVPAATVSTPGPPMMGQPRSVNCANCAGNTAVSNRGLNTRFHHGQFYFSVVPDYPSAVPSSPLEVSSFEFRVSRFPSPLRPCPPHWTLECVVTPDTTIRPFF